MKLKNENEKIFDSPDKLRFVVKNLMRSNYINTQYFDKTGKEHKGDIIGTSTEVEVTDFGQIFELTLTDGNIIIEEEETKKYMRVDRFEPTSDPVVYSYDELPYDVFKQIIKKIPYYADENILDYVDLVTNIINKHIYDEEHVQCNPSDYELLFDTGDLPCIEDQSNRFHDDSFAKLKKIRVAVKSYDGISIFEDGKPIVEDVSPHEIEQWKSNSENYLELVEILAKLKDKFYYHW